MFKLDSYRTGVPIKVWLENKGDLEDTAYEEACIISKLPFAESHIALMADAHATGYNMPVGGVLATKGVVIPDAVSNDIGCGVIFAQTSIPAKVLKIETSSGTLGQMLVGSVMRDVPTGFQHNDPEIARRDYRLLDIIEKYKDIGVESSVEPYAMNGVIEQAYEIVGTLGSGNHFIEFQENEEGNIGIMIHTGSRSVGAYVHSHFNNLAKELNEQWYVNLIEDIKLPFLPLESEYGKQYLNWMNFALEIAEYNRELIMEIAQDKLLELLKKYTNFKSLNIQRETNMHHNYAAYEHVKGENYMVHRKGAVRARKGDIIPVPGAMGSSSYIVEGLGNEESFKSCSHGAGRVHTRTSAKEEFSVQEVMEDLNSKGVILGKRNKENVAEEYLKAYKDIDTVIENQKDLIKPLDKLKTLAVIKG